MLGNNLGMLGNNPEMLGNITQIRVTGRKSAHFEKTVKEPPSLGQVAYCFIASSTGNLSFVTSSTGNLSFITSSTGNLMNNSTSSSLKERLFIVIKHFSQ